MAVNNKSPRSKTKNEEDDIRLDVDVWDVSIEIYLFLDFSQTKVMRFGL